MEKTSRRYRQLRATGLVCLVFLSSILLRPCHGKEPLGGSAGAADASAPVDRGLRILYAGRPGSDREKDFLGFLKKHFDVVQTGDLTRFDGSQSEGFDVTILDYDGDGFKAPRPTLRPRFLDESVEISRPMPGPLFARPLITVGVAGGLMCDRWGLKTGYL
jgi:hypothetical protein